MKQHFRMFAHYNRWANARLYDACALLGDDDYRIDLGAFFGSIYRTLNHILVADRIWMRRFTGEGDLPASLDSIVAEDFDLLRVAREEEDERIVDWIDDIPDHAMSGRFTYTTVTDMRTISQHLAPALAHFFNHQTHHRGQAHAMLTRLGEDVPPLDLIYFLRVAEGREFA
ncbi:MAG: DinB family protein [Rhizobiaceae bacterium]